MDCDYCGKPAYVNIQKIWICWELDSETGEYSKKHKLLLDANEPTSNENLHLCSKCFNDWKNGQAIL
jgi:hypothetical protein